MEDKDFIYEVIAELRADEKAVDEKILMRGPANLMEKMVRTILDFKEAAQPAVCPNCGEPEPVLHCEKCGHNFNR